MKVNVIRAVEFQRINNRRAGFDSQSSLNSCLFRFFFKLVRFVIHSTL